MNSTQLPESSLLECVALRPGMYGVETLREYLAFVQGWSIAKAPSFDGYNAAVQLQTQIPHLLGFPKNWLIKKVGSLDRIEWRG